MGANTKDRHITRHAHLGCDLLVFTALEIGAGVNCVLACPASRTENRIQAVGIRSLRSVWHDLAAESAVHLTLTCVGDPPFDDSGIKRHFQQSHKLFDLVRSEETWRTGHGGWSRPA